MKKSNLNHEQQMQIMEHREKELSRGLIRKQERIDKLESDLKHMTKWWEKEAKKARKLERENRELNKQIDRKNRRHQTYVDGAKSFLKERDEKIKELKERNENLEDKIVLDRKYMAGNTVSDKEFEKEVSRLADELYMLGAERCSKELNGEPLGGIEAEIEEKRKELINLEIKLF
ncbi:MAG: hypothetical protein ACOC5G_04135 [Acidobacteriota bacterium]